MRANRVCKTCGKQYYYCSNCQKNLNSPEWMLLWDTQNCKSVFEIVSDYDQKHITKEQARERLLKCNLREEYTFTEKIRNLVDEIMESNKSAKTVDTNLDSFRSIESQKSGKKNRGQRNKK